MIAVAAFAVVGIIAVNILVLIFPAAAGCATEVAFAVAFTTMSTAGRLAGREGRACSRL